MPVTLPVDLEIDRIMNLIRGFGWEKVKLDVQKDKIVLTVEKPMSSE